MTNENLEKVLIYCPTNRQNLALSSALQQTLGLYSSEKVKVTTNSPGVDVASELMENQINRERYGLIVDASPIVSERTSALSLLSQMNLTTTPDVKVVRNLSTIFADVGKILSDYVSSREAAK